MELYKNVYQIQSLYGGRNLFQYLLVGANVVLVDTGIAETPEKVIFPYMDRLKLQPNRLTFAVTTHADLDHQGGNDAIKQSSPGTFLACGEGDRALVEDPRALFDARYNFMRAEHGVGFENDPPPDAGRTTFAAFAGFAGMACSSTSPALLIAMAFVYPKPAGRTGLNSDKGRLPIPAIRPDKFIMKMA